MKISAFRKEFLVKDSMYGVENNIFLYMVHKGITIILIPNKYHQFKIWHKFIGTNFIGMKYICFIIKDIEVHWFWFIIQKDLLRCFLFEISNRYIIVYIWVAAEIANSYQKSDRHASSYIDCAFLSNMWFNHLVWPFC